MTLRQKVLISRKAKFDTTRFKTNALTMALKTCFWLLSSEALLTIVVVTVLSLHTTFTLVRVALVWVVAMTFVRLVSSFVTVQIPTRRCRIPTFEICVVRGPVLTVQANPLQWAHCSVMRKTRVMIRKTKIG